MKSPSQSLSRFSAAALLFFCLLLAGCSTRRGSSSPQDAELARLKSPQPELLYLLASPHRQLYVEVDAVKGCEPTDRALQRLRGFLSEQCNKPEGVEVVRGDVIPPGAVRGISPRGLARKYMSGPPTATNAAPPAFLYVLYYNYGLSGKTDVILAGQKSAGAAGMIRPGIPNPYTETVLYPAIYMNPNYSLGFVLDEILLHEAGHALGLVNRTNHAQGAHCVNPGCSMNRGRDYMLHFRWLTGRKPGPLCADCLAELKQRSTQPPPANLRFVGPVLVRSQTNYHVLHLPDRVGLIVGDFSTEDCDTFADAVRAEKPGPTDDDLVHTMWQIKDEALSDPARLGDMIDELKTDPFVLLQTFGPRALLESAVRHYQSASQYANAVHALQLAIPLNPGNARTYNSLAWIQASCPDASVRNGAEAIAAATKACELTQWKNWSFIDTLAAAQAEAGDFKRAIEFQERALHASNPGGSEQKRMEERLSLYEQSQPFRERPNRP